MPGIVKKDKAISGKDRLCLQDKTYCSGRKTARLELSFQLTEMAINLQNVGLM
jgi:hypothetical protein